MLDFKDIATRFGFVGKPSSEADLEGGGVGRTADRSPRVLGRRREDTLLCGPHVRLVT